MSTTSDPRGGRGLFLVLEGIEGVGKSTQVRALSQAFDSEGIPHRTAREPGGTPVGEAVRNLVLKRTDLDVSAEAELFLILASRAAYVQDVVRPALEAGEVFLSDRFDSSTLAYQAYGRGLDLDAVTHANEIATGGLSPDLILWLDAPVEEGLARRVQESGSLDRIEQAGVAFLKRVAAGYAALAQASDRVERIDATRGPTEVSKQIRACLRRRFPDVFSALESRSP